MAILQVSDLDLSRFLDRELAPERRLEIEDALAASPVAAARLAAFRRQNSALLEMFPAGENDAPKQPVRGGGEARKTNAKTGRGADPIRQTIRVERLASGQMRESRRARTALTAVASFLAGAAAALFAAAGLGFMPAFLEGARMAAPRQVEAIFIADPFQSFVSRAIAVHQTFALDAAKPVEFSVSEGGAASVAGALSKRVGFPVAPPDLSARGYALLGGRIVPNDFGNAAFLVYESRAKERIGLLVGYANGLSAASPRIIESLVTAGVWTLEDKVYALTARAGRAALAPLLDQARTQMTKTAAP